MSDDDSQLRAAQELGLIDADVSELAGTSRQLEASLSSAHDQIRSLLAALADERKVRIGVEMELKSSHQEIERLLEMRRALEAKLELEAAAQERLSHTSKGVYVLNDSMQPTTLWSFAACMKCKLDKSASVDRPRSGIHPPRARNKCSLADCARGVRSCGAQDAGAPSWSGCLSHNNPRTAQRE
jgi:hypothetical protein